MDEMAQRWHKHADIDGQADITSVILPPLRPTHAPYRHPLLHLLCLSILWIPSLLLSVFLFFSLLFHTTHSFLIISGSHSCFLTVSAFRLSFSSSLSLFAVANMLTCSHHSCDVTQDQTTTMLLRLKDTLDESVLQLLRNNHKHTGAYLSSAALIDIITNYPVSSSAHMNSYYNNEL